jgi:hypothetical protein
MWVTIPYEDDKIAYSYEPHSFKKIYKSVSWEVCIYCGLVALRNDFTRWAMKTGCMNRYHKDYEKARTGK